jgi:hypothetical protein
VSPTTNLLIVPQQQTSLDSRAKEKRTSKVSLALELGVEVWTEEVWLKNLNESLGSQWEAL